jgi:5-methylcytosine-specific restriction enzyme A
MKVMNFRRFDPVYISQGKKGVQRGGKLEEEVWNYFAEDTIELAQTAKAIRQIVTKRQIPIAAQDENDEFVEAEEGAVIQRRMLRQLVSLAPRRLLLTVAGKVGASRRGDRVTS